jgi:DNA-binding beta-propeller fold protein YncE
MTAADSTTSAQAITTIPPEPSWQVTSILEADNRSGFTLQVGNSLWVSNAGSTFVSGGVTVIDIATRRVLGSFELSGYPTRMLEVDDSVWVVRSGDEFNVAVVDTETLELRDDIAVSVYPWDLLEVDGNIWITDRYEGTVSVLDSDRRVLVNTIALGRSAVDLLMVDGSVWVINEGDGMVEVVDVATQQVSGGTSRYLSGPASSGPETAARLWQLGWFCRKSLFGTRTVQHGGDKQPVESNDYDRGDGRS